MCIFIYLGTYVGDINELFIAYKVFHGKVIVLNISKFNLDSYKVLQLYASIFNLHRSIA